MFTWKIGLSYQNDKLEKLFQRRKEKTNKHRDEQHPSRQLLPFNSFHGSKRKKMYIIMKKLNLQNL